MDSLALTHSLSLTVLSFSQGDVGKPGLPGLPVSTQYSIYSTHEIIDIKYVTTAVETSTENKVVFLKGIGVTVN